MGAWLTLAGPGTEPPRCQPRRGKPPRETAATVSNSRGWGSWEFCARFSPTVGAECRSELLRAVRALQPPSRGAFPHPLCRQNHSRPSHGTVETWSGSPTPPCAPNHKLMAAEQGKNFLPGESRGPGWGHWRWGGSRWGLGLPQGLGMEGWKQVLCPGEGGSGLALSPSASLFLFPRHLGPQGGRPGCSDQQAGGAYWTAGEQGGPAEPPHPSLHPPSTLPAPQGEIRPEFTRGKSGNLNAPGRGWRGGVD